MAVKLMRLLEKKRKKKQKGDVVALLVMLNMN